MSKKCERCGKVATWLKPLADGKICDECWASDGEAIKVEQTIAAEQKRALQAQEKARLAEDAASAARIILTTETAHNLPVTERLGIISAEVVIGMNLFKDLATAFTDTFGGRSKNMQNGLRQARESALAELRQEAHALGADAVVGIDLDYSEISGGGKSMLFLVASGTAVKLST